MNVQQAQIDQGGQKTAKFKTTLYLTENNRKQLDQLNRGSRTKLINQAIAEKLADLQREKLKEKLLDSLENSASVPSNGVLTEDALHEIRGRELNNLLQSS